MEKTTENLSFTKDKPVIILAVICGVLAFSNLILSLIRLNSHDFKVPVQYIVNDGSVLQTSSWYTLYSIALVSILGAGAVIFLAQRLHKANRLFAAGVLAIYVFICVVSLFVTYALLGLVGRV